MIPLGCCMSRRKDGFTMTYSEKNRVFLRGGSETQLNMGH